MEFSEFLGYNIQVNPVHTLFMHFKSVCRSKVGFACKHGAYRTHSVCLILSAYSQSCVFIANQTLLLGVYTTHNPQMSAARPYIPQPYNVEAIQRVDMSTEDQSETPVFVRPL